MKGMLEIPRVSIVVSTSRIVVFDVNALVRGREQRARIRGVEQIHKKIVVEMPVRFEITAFKILRNADRQAIDLGNERSPGDENTVTKGEDGIPVRNGRQPRQVVPVTDFFGHVQPEPRFVVNRQFGSAGEAAYGKVGGRDLGDHLFVVKRDEELVIIDRDAAIPPDATVRDVVIHQAELEFFVKLVEQQPEVRGIAWPGGKGKGDHVPAAAPEVWLISPGSWQMFEGSELGVSRYGKTNVTCSAPKEVARSIFHMAVLSGMNWQELQHPGTSDEI